MIVYYYKYIFILSNKIKLNRVPGLQMWTTLLNHARYETVSTQRELDISKNASKFLEKVENRFIGIFHLFVFTTFAILQKLPLGVAPLAHTQYIL